MTGKETGINSNIFYSDYVPLSVLTGQTLRFENRRVKMLDTNEIKKVQLVFVFERWGMLIENVELIWFYKPEEVEVLPLDGSENNDDIKPLSEELVNFTNNLTEQKPKLSPEDWYKRDEEITKRCLERDKEELKEYWKSDKKFKITQHLPAYFSGFELEENEFDTIEELLDIEWIKRWSIQPEFYQYSLGFREPIERIHLIAEIDGGKTWWVVGRIVSIDNYEYLINKIPKWHEGE